MKKGEQTNYIWYRYIYTRCLRKKIRLWDALYILNLRLPNWNSKCEIWLIDRQWREVLLNYTKIIGLLIICEYLCVWLAKDSSYRWDCFVSKVIKSETAKQKGKSMCGWLAWFTGFKFNFWQIGITLYNSVSDRRTVFNLQETA